MSTQALWDRQCWLPRTELRRKGIHFWIRRRQGQSWGRRLGPAVQSEYMRNVKFNLGERKRTHICDIIMVLLLGVGLEIDRRHLHVFE